MLTSFPSHIHINSKFLTKHITGWKTECNSACFHLCQSGKYHNWKRFKAEVQNLFEFGIWQYLFVKSNLFQCFDIFITHQYVHTYAMFIVCYYSNTVSKDWVKNLFTKISGQYNKKCGCWPRKVMPLFGWTRVRFSEHEVALFSE